MVMVSINDNTRNKLNKLVADFKETYPTIKINQDYVILKALTKLEGDYQ